jgi:hypothetical protein
MPPEERRLGKSRGRNRGSLGGGSGREEVTTRTMGASTSLSRYSIPPRGVAVPPRTLRRLRLLTPSPRPARCPAKLGVGGVRGESCCGGNKGRLGGAPGLVELWCGRAGREQGAVSSPVSSQCPPSLVGFGPGLLKSVPTGHFPSGGPGHAF